MIPGEWIKDFVFGMPLYTYQGIYLSGDRMAKVRQIQVQVLHYPTLKTVMAIEEAVKSADTAISRNRIIDKLEGKVMRSTLNCALDYLEKRGIILETKKGFIWTFNPNGKLARAEAKGLEV